MPIEVTFVKLELDDSDHGALVWRDGALVAVLSRLGAGHGEGAGAWHAEIVLSSSGRTHLPLFSSIEAAVSYFEAEAIPFG